MDNDLIDNNLAQILCDQVAEAYNTASPLKISAGNSKDFYGRKVDGTVLSLSENSGIIP